MQAVLARLRRLALVEDGVAGVEFALILPIMLLVYIGSVEASLAPDNCVFIDDSEPNIVAARRYGMHGIHFKDPAMLRKELIALGLPLKAK